MSHFFKRRWDEPQFGELASWGCSWWFFETDGEGWILRQVEVDDEGPTLRYDEEHPKDELGMLGDQALDLEEIPRVCDDAGRV